MNRVEKSLLDTDILSEIIKRANPQIIAKADIYLYVIFYSQFYFLPM
ncbi:hypothetical protein [Dolichospermum heterosporum]|uniref:PIN domain-containing protein n=1 Tax=Dolichospermum heterosporum TAC447 TaxID=747523 RepID=A0ABY5LRA8_9CYAN|nr:hypothetical protein [Dolichospermum heterosporum]UUO13245.1 hypothetical protein NG743_14155 [Dolichospermum heterosporum TAC447]